MLTVNLDARSVTVLVVDAVDPRPLLQHLADTERARAAAYSDRLARARFVSSRCALRWWLGKLTGQTPSQVEITADPLGTPIAPRTEWQISISHAHTLSVVAISPGVRVGLDVEARRPFDDALSIAEHHFHPEECAWLRDSQGERLAARFLRLWVRKEAVAKAAGTGLAMPLRTWSALRRTPRGASFNVRDADRRSWWIHEPHMGADHWLAIATASDIKVGSPARLPPDWHRHIER